MDADSPSATYLVQLQQQLQELEIQISEQERSAARSQSVLQVQIEELRSQLAARQTLNQRQRDDIVSLQEQVETIQLDWARERRQWEERNQQLQAELLEARDLADSRANSVQRFKAELSLTRTHVAELEHETAEVKSALDTERCHWASLQASLEARLAGYAETEAEMAQRWQDDQATWEAQLTQLQASYSTLEAEQANTARLTNERDELLQRQTELQQQLDALRTELIELQQTHQTVLGEAEATAQQIAEREATVQGLIVDRERLASLEGDHVTLARELESERLHAKKLDAEIYLWKQKVADQELHALRLKAALDRAADPQVDLDEPAVELRNLPPLPLKPDLSPKAESMLAFSTLDEEFESSTQDDDSLLEEIDSEELPDVRALDVRGAALPKFVRGS